jgi:hypothetical protein
MPKNKDLKRLTRSRMEKTGESYTSARAQLLVKAEAKPEPAVDFATLAGTSDEAVKKATGCDWERWVYALDRKGAANLSHREIARKVRDDYKLGSWWAQTVTVGYERIKGFREIGQRRGGSYRANKTKALPVPVGRLYRAFRDSRTRRRWLPDIDLTVRTATPDKSMRITWNDGSSVEVQFTAKDEAKSSVAIQHDNLGSKEEVARMKAFWTARLTALGEVLAAR